MPKLTLLEPAVQTFLPETQEKLGDDYSSFTCSARGYIVNKQQIRERFGKASPREKEQIIAFVKAAKTFYRYWKLAHYTNHNTGRKHLTAAVTGDGPGLSRSEFMKLLGVI